MNDLANTIVAEKFINGDPLVLLYRELERYCVENALPALSPNDLLAQLLMSGNPADQTHIDYLKNYNKRWEAACHPQPN